MLAELADFLGGQPILALFLAIGAGYAIGQINLFGFSLGNSGDGVLLWQVNGGDTTLVDAYTYRSHEAAADRASGRQPDATGTWALHDGLNPYSGTASPPGTGCMPTPGAANTCSSTPARAPSWGEIKSRYR